MDPYIFEGWVCDQPPTELLRAIALAAKEAWKTSLTLQAAHHGKLYVLKLACGDGLSNNRDMNHVWNTVTSLEMMVFM